MGQTSQVVVHRLVGDETADERLLEVLADKRRIFDAYARSSETAEAPDAVDVSEGDLARTIIAAERRRLGFDGADGKAEGPEPGKDDPGESSGAGPGDGASAGA